MERGRDYRIGLVMVSAAALAWSSAGYFTRLIPADAWTTQFWRGIFGGLFIALFAVAWLRRGLWAAIRGLGWPGWLIVVNGAVGMTAFITSLKLTSVADVSIIYATLPFVAAGLGWVWVRERVAASTILASTVAAAGVAIMVSGTTLSGHLGGDALAFLQTVTMAVAIVAIRRYVFGRSATEEQVRRVLSGGDPHGRPVRPLWHLSIVEGDGVLQLRQLDGWLANVVDRAYREACRVLRARDVPVSPFSRAQLESGSWAPTIEARLPSLVIARKYLRRCGVRPSGSNT